jgi:dipeptidyl aminopeptidase/acylaminoacyl peptidase
VPIKGSPADFGQPYEDVAFPATDGLILRGWFLPAASSGPLYRGKRAIIIVHGKDNNRTGQNGKMIPMMVDLSRQGYHVLAYDTRCRGESEGNFYSLGHFERSDVLGAVDYLKSHGFIPGSIGVLGSSMGAATALLTAAKSTDISAVVSDSSFADLRLALDVLLPDESGLPAFFNEPIYQMAKLLRGIDVDAVSPMRINAKIGPRPILLTHGKVDKLIPVDHAYLLYEASDKAHTELWVVDGVGHTAIYGKMPKEYIERIANFFDGGLAISEEAAPEG